MQGLANLTGYLLSAMGLTVLIIWPEGGPGADGAWFTDDDVQSNYGGNEIIYCGYRYDAETQNYYVRNRYYSPLLGRWITRDPIGYEGGINLYGYVSGWAPRLTDASGESFWTWVGVGVAIGLIAGVVVASQIVPGVNVIVTAAGTVAITGLVETATGLAAGAAIGAVAGAATGGLVESQLARKTERGASDCGEDDRDDRDDRDAPCSFANCSAGRLCGAFGSGRSCQWRRLLRGGLICGCYAGGPQDER